MAQHLGTGWRDDFAVNPPGEQYVIRDASHMEEDEPVTDRDLAWVSQSGIVLEHEDDGFMSRVLYSPAEIDELEAAIYFYRHVTGSKMSPTANVRLVDAMDVYDAKKRAGQK